MNSLKVNVNVTRFLGENAQVNAITGEINERARVVLIGVTWLLAHRYRRFWMGRNRSSVAETVEQKFNSISPCSRETLARNRTTKLRKIILITSNDCERFILSHSFFIISFLSHYSVNRKEEKKKEKNRSHYFHRSWPIEHKRSIANRCYVTVCNTLRTMRRSFDCSSSKYYTPRPVL